MIEAGQTAPDFALPDQHGAIHRLSDHRGSPAVVYFYPKDDTPGCTKEACSFRDNWQALQDAGIAVFGISADDVESHRSFADKHNLPFPILSDPEMNTIQAYGAWGMKNMYGKKFESILRYTFVIDGDGTVIKVFKRPRTEIHAEEVLVAV
mgnify:CR=1 FL=1